MDESVESRAKEYVSVYEEGRIEKGMRVIEIESKAAREADVCQHRPVS